MPGQQKDELLRAARCPNCGRCDAVVTRLGLVAHSDAGKIGFDDHRHRFERRPRPEHAAEPAAASRPWPKRRRHRREARLQP